MNEQTNNTNTETLKKFKRYLTYFVIAVSGTLTGRFLHVYTDYKKHPAMYTAPYPTWLERLDMDFIVYGTTILICVAIVAVLTFILKKQNQLPNQNA